MERTTKSERGEVVEVSGRDRSLQLPVHEQSANDDVTAAMRIDGTRLGGHGEETDAVAATG